MKGGASSCLGTILTVVFFVLLLLSKIPFGGIGEWMVDFIADHLFEPFLKQLLGKPLLLQQGAVLGFFWLWGLVSSLVTCHDDIKAIMHDSIVFGLEMWLLVGGGVLLYEVKGFSVAVMWIAVCILMKAVVEIARWRRSEG